MSQVGSLLRCHGREMALPCCSTSQIMGRVPTSPNNEEEINQRENITSVKHMADMTPLSSLL